MLLVLVGWRMGKTEVEGRVYRFCRGNRRVKFTEALVRGGVGRVYWFWGDQGWSTLRLWLEEEKARIYRFCRGKKIQEFQIGCWARYLNFWKTLQRQFTCSVIYSLDIMQEFNRG